MRRSEFPEDDEVEAGEIVGDAALLAGAMTGSATLRLHHVYEELHLGSRAELAWVAPGKGLDHPGTGLL